MKTDHDIVVLRELAARYAEIANDPVNMERRTLHTAVNDLKLMRPVVLIDEIPWHEMNIGNELTLKCTDPDYRKVEDYFRKELYKWNHMQADMIVRPFYGVQKIVETTGIGMTASDEVRLQAAPGADSAIMSHHYENQIESEEDIEKLHRQVLTYKEKETYELFDKIAAAISDILPVKIVGIESGYDNSCKNWDDIAFFMGAENLFYALADEPEMMHKLTGKLTDIFLDTVRQYEELNLYEPNQIYLHATTALNSKLSEGLDYQHVTAKHMWGRGLAQIFASVSKEMRKEFDIEYMKKAMAPFGLVYYGCCEPLHNMIDIVSEIPNIRKIGITPWADVDEGAANIGGRYVMAFKPNPAFVTDFDLYEETVRQEIGRMLAACRRNGTPADIVIKDISTVGKNPENLFRWEKLVMQMVKEFEY